MYLPFSVTAAQTGNVSLGLALIAILCIAAGANYWYIGKLLLKFSDIDRKMDW